MTSIFDAIKNEDISNLQKLISEKRDLNKPDEDGFTPLMIAAEGKNPEIINMLIDNGAIVDAKYKYGETPLMFALGWGKNPDVIKALIDGGADVNAKTNGGTTALIRAARYGHLDVVKLLIEKGADVNATNNWGRTASDYAAENGYYEIEELLEKA